MNHLLRWTFFAGPVRLLVLLIMGLNVRGRSNLPLKGPALIVANHNSHLDTLTLISLMPLSVLRQIQPVAALDYFLRSKWLAWFALNIIGILPIERGASANPLAASNRALAAGKILILFPEGSRGMPEQRSEFKRGVALLVKENPDVPVIPVFMHGLGKALPKGTKLFVPFVCDIFIGAPMPWTGDSKTFMATMKDRFDDMEKLGTFPPWE